MCGIIGAAGRWKAYKACKSLFYYEMFGRQPRIFFFLLLLLSPLHDALVSPRYIVCSIDFEQLLLCHFGTLRFKELNLNDFSSLTQRVPAHAILHDQFVNFFGLVCAQRTWKICKILKGK